MFTTRRGGHSAAPFDSLNLGRWTDDDPAAVRTVRANLESVGIEYLRGIEKIVRFEEHPPLRNRYAGAELVCNISGSPYRVGIHDTRKELIATRAAEVAAALSCPRPASGRRCAGTAEAGWPLPRGGMPRYGPADRHLDGWLGRDGSPRPGG